MLDDPEAVQTPLTAQDAVFGEELDELLLAHGAGEGVYGPALCEEEAGGHALDAERLGDLG